MHVQYMYNKLIYERVVRRQIVSECVHLIDVYEIYEMSNII